MNKMIKLYTQQGDCVLEIVKLVPKEAKRIKVINKLVVLKGEGVNVHEITDVSGLEVYEQGDVMYLKTDKEVVLVHSEHGRTVLAPNKIYRRRIEREFDYERMEARQTRD